jgi:hypothetical protein
MSAQTPLHPSQFKVNEAWIVFKLNHEPIHTVEDGDFDFLALMDAASCYILGSTPVAVKQAEPSALEARSLLQAGHAHRARWPTTLFVPREQRADSMVIEAEQHGIEVVRVAEANLSVFIGEAQQGFRERFAGPSTH